MRPEKIGKMLSLGSDPELCVDERPARSWHARWFWPSVAVAALLGAISALVWARSAWNETIRINDPVYPTTEDR